ncbi:MAG: ribulokinase [Bacteroidales bacterium]|nr:ribulokinase [Bacteroidales bacterium]
MGKFVIGVDYGTDSARAILVDAFSGEILAGKTAAYPRWAEGKFCDAAKAQFRQHPKDYLEVLETILKGVIGACPEPENIVSISIDTTASTPCFADRTLTPLALKPGFEEDPSAMFILWKDHTAMAESVEINTLCDTKGYPYTCHSGGVYSAENYWSKVLHIVRTAPQVAENAYCAIECCDWISAVLSGCNDMESFRPGHCCLGAKWMWAEEWGGFPPESFFDELDPRLNRLALPKENFGCDKPAGTLCAEWAAKLGLPETVRIGVGNIDSYSGAVGGGVRYKTIILNLGTSSCYMAVMPKEIYGSKVLPGVFAQVDGSILPGQVGFEVGLSAFGDVYAWVKNFLSWPLRKLDPERAAEIEGTMIADLSEAAAALPEREDAPLATDYLNGRRSPFGDNSLTGTLEGLRLSTSAPEVFRAFVEATCFATKAVMDHLEKGGVEIGRYVAVGGVAQKSPFVMQMLSDVLGKEIEVSSAKDSCALGAAVHAAVIAGLYPSVEAAEDALCPPTSRKYTPGESSVLSKRYARYLTLAGL